MAEATFNFWDITPKFLSVTMLVTVDLQTTFKTLRVSTCMTYLRIKLHILQRVHELLPTKQKPKKISGCRHTGMSYSQKTNHFNNAAFFSKLY
jgi:hypothetical protein